MACTDFPHLPSVDTDESGRANHFPSGKKFSLSRELRRDAEARIMGATREARIMGATREARIMGATREARIMGATREARIMVPRYKGGKDKLILYLHPGTD